MKENKKINEEKSTSKKVYVAPKVRSYPIEVEGVLAQSLPTRPPVWGEDDRPDPGNNTGGGGGFGTILPEKPSSYDKL